MSKIIPVGFNNTVDILTDIVKASVKINKPAVLNQEKIFDKYVSHIEDYSYEPIEYTDKAKEFVRDIIDNELADIKDNSDLIIDSITSSFLTHTMSCIDEIPKVGITNMDVVGMIFDIMRHFETLDIVSKIKISIEDNSIYITDPMGEKRLVEANVEITEGQNPAISGEGPACMKELLMLYIVTRHMNDEKEIIELMVKRFFAKKYSLDTMKMTFSIVSRLMDIDAKEFLKREIAEATEGE